MSSIAPLESRTSAQPVPSGRSNIFLCFAPEEAVFAQSLDESLRKRRRVSAINWSNVNQSVSLGRDVLERIEAAETFIFIVSPSSVSSDVCRRQLDLAVKLKKAIVPVVRREISTKDTPASLAGLTPIDYREESDQTKAFEAIIAAANSNLRIDVFICYSRVDKPFVNRLYEGLIRTGRRVWLDLSSIPTSTLWDREIFAGIEAADNFIFVISPDSIRPDSFCHKEFGHATEHNKRIIPLYYRDTDASAIPPKLGQYQRRDFPVNGDFDANFQRLVDDLDQDPEYLREHTRLLTRALEWQRSDHDKSLLLHGSDLKHAETLLRTSAEKQPQFTNLQTQYVFASREAANRTRNKLLGSVVAALISTAGLSVRLFFQTRAANAARRNAEQQVLISQARELVLVGESKIKEDPQLSLLLAIEASKKNIKAEGQVDTRTASLLRRAVMVGMDHISTESGGIEAVSWKPNSGILAAGSSDGNVIVLSAGDSKIVDRFKAAGWIESLSWTSDGELLAVATRENAVTIWNSVERKTLEPLSFSDQVVSVSWRSNPRQLAVALARGNNSVVQVIDWGTKAVQFEVPGIRGAWSHDGSLLATGGGEGVVNIFDGSGQLLAQMPGHDRYVHDIAWTADDKRFATSSVDGNVMVWDAVAHQRIVTLKSEFALGVTWSPDGSRLASGTGNSVVSVWDGSTYKELQGFKSADTLTGDSIAGSGARGYVVDVDWSPDGKLLAASERGDFIGGQGSVLLLPPSLFMAMDAQDWLKVAQTVVRRSLTDAECREYLHSECGAG